MAADGCVGPSPGRAAGGAAVSVLIQPYCLLLACRRHDVARLNAHRADRGRPCPSKIGPERAPECQTRPMTAPVAATQPLAGWTPPGTADTDRPTPVRSESQHRGPVRRRYRSIPKAVNSSWTCSRVLSWMPEERSVHKGASLRSATDTDAAAQDHPAPTNSEKPVTAAISFGMRLSGVGLL